jgi:hypothetical protein
MMKNERIFLSGLLVVLCVFLGAHVMAGERRDPIETRQKPDVGVKKHDPKKSLKTKRKKVTKKTKSQSPTPSDSDNSTVATQKPLDLTIPYTDVEKNRLLTEQSTEIPPQSTNIFASENKKKTRQLQVDGRFLMSQELEKEKQKSADGAGIVINLKP